MVVPPKVVFSDHDDKIETALRRMQVDAWPDHLHFLCVYHISKNVFQHLRGLFLADGGGVLWKAVFDRFWKITKNTDSSYRDTFDADWGAFVDMVRDTASNKDKLPAELRWLTTLGSLAHRFAYCFTWQTCTLGMHSTQRIGMQSVAKNVMGLNTRTKLLEVQDAMEACRCKGVAKHGELLERKPSLRHGANMLAAYLIELERTDLPRQQSHGDFTVRSVDSG